MDLNFSQRDPGKTKGIKFSLVIVKHRNESYIYDFKFQYTAIVAIHLNIIACI